jgi:hypothetical protein
LDELVGFGAVLDPFDEVGARESPLTADAGRGYGALSGELVDCGFLDAENVGRTLHIEDTFVHLEGFLPA